MIIDIQLSPAIEPWEAVRDGVLCAEEAGYAAAWVFDHFAGAALGGRTMLECFTLLGGLAAVTERIALGTLVVNVANRHPAVMAMSAATAQAMSGGRLILGLGAGAAPNTAWSAEHRALDIELEPTIARRHVRLAAALDELDRLWDPRRPAELATFPIPEPRPPVVLGVNSEPLATIAGDRCDGMNVRGDHPDLVALVSAARRARDASARTTPWELSVWAHWDDALADPAHPDRRRWAELGVDRLIMVCFRQPHDPAALRRFLR